MKNLVLICGGRSPEHEISIQSAKNILHVLDRDKYRVRVIGISKSGRWLLMKKEKLEAVIPEQGTAVQICPGRRDCFTAGHHSLGTVDAIFPVLHGPNGEDGAIQGLIQMLNIPFVGPGIMSSAMAMDKDIAKKLLRCDGLRVADWILIQKGERIPDFTEASRRLKANIMFVKPANMGSSIGISRVGNEQEWEQAIDEAFSLDKKVLVEKDISGRELECAVIGNRQPEASGVGEVKSGGIYSYDQKYTDDSSAKTIIPADNISTENMKKLRETAVKAYRILECEGLSRVDMFLTEEGFIYVSEVNTMPGFTDISMYPLLWQQEGVTYPQLVDRLVELAKEKHAIRRFTTSNVRG